MEQTGPVPAGLDQEASGGEHPLGKRPLMRLPRSVVVRGGGQSLQEGEAVTASVEPGLLLGAWGRRALQSGKKDEWREKLKERREAGRSPEGAA